MALSGEIKPILTYQRGWSRMLLPCSIILRLWFFISLVEPRVSYIYPCSQTDLIVSRICLNLPGFAPYFPCHFRYSWLVQLIQTLNPTICVLSLLSLFITPDFVFQISQLRSIYSHKGEILKYLRQCTSNTNNKPATETLYPQYSLFTSLHPFGQTCQPADQPPWT